jgi:hypothetical protein
MRMLEISRGWRRRELAADGEEENWPRMEKKRIGRGWRRRELAAEEKKRIGHGWTQMNTDKREEGCCARRALS